MRHTVGPDQSSTAGERPALWHRRWPV